MDIVCLGEILTKVFPVDVKVEGDQITVGPLFEDDHQIRHLQQLCTSLKAFFNQVGFDLYLEQDPQTFVATLSKRYEFFPI